MEALEARIAALKAKGKEGKAELDALLKEHTDDHGDAILLEPLIMKHKSGTKVFIVDPMHCLELNISKTLWKYSFGDRMTDADREEVAAYLTSIGLHLDIRAKGKRDPQQKWFSAAQFDEFVLGTSYYTKSKSPGLSANIMAIVDIIFSNKTSVADAVDAASTAASTDAAAAAPPPPKKAKSRKDRHTAPIAGGFSAGDVTMADASVAPSLDALRGADLSADSDAVATWLRTRYGNHAATVVEILKGWETYGDLFSEWREAWTEDTDAYRAKRSLQFARCARDFMRALNSLSNYKQKSWYTHAIVWICWQQIFLFGNTWPMGTMAIESRNARIKRYGRRFTNWRPFVAGETSYHYVDRRSGVEKTGTRKYNSSPVHQMLQRLALSEKGWHTTNKFSAPQKLRLQAQLRSRVLKIEVADVAPPEPPKTMFAQLAGKV